MRLNRTRARRIPNTIAIFGALLLTASLLAGARGGAEPSAQTLMAGPSSEAVQPANATEDGLAGQAVKSSRKKFRVKLFLFRR